MAFGNFDGCPACGTIDIRELKIGDLRNSVLKEIYKTLDSHNRISKLLISEKCIITNENKLNDLGIPLQISRIAVQWTEEWLESATVGTLITQFHSALQQDLINIRDAFQKAIYNPINNLEYFDDLTDGIIIPLRAFYNGDGEEVKNGPGVILNPSSQTHYTSSMKWSARDIRNLISNVTEHGTVGKLELQIHYEDVKKFCNLETSSTLFSNSKLNNTLIGYFDGVEVWIKPSAIKNYVVCYDLGREERVNEENGKIIPAIRPLAFRYLYDDGDLVTRYEHEEKPLNVSIFRRIFGIGVVNRHMSAVHQFGSEEYISPV